MLLYAFLALFGAVRGDSVKSRCGDVGVMRWVDDSSGKRNHELTSESAENSYNCQESCAVTEGCGHWVYQERYNPTSDSIDRFCELIPAEQFDLQSPVDEPMIPEGKDTPKEKVHYIVSGPALCPHALDEASMNPMTRLEVMKLEASTSSMGDQDWVSMAVTSKMWFTLRIVGNRPGVVNVFKTIKMVKWLDDNNFMLQMDNGAGGFADTPMDSSMSDMTWGEFKDMNWGEDASNQDFEAAVQLRQKTAIENGADMRQETIDKLNQRIEDAKAAQADARALLNLDDDSFAQQWTQVKAEHGFQQGDFAVEQMDMADKKTAVMTALSTFQSDMEKQVGLATAQLSMDADPYNRVLELAQATNVKGIVVESITKPVARMSTDTFSNQYYSEKRKTDIDNHMYSENSIHAASLTGQAAGILSFGLMAGSVSASAKYQWNSELDRTTLNQHEISEVAIARRHVSQIYNFKVDGIKLNDKIMVAAKQLGQTLGHSSMCMRQYGNRRTNDFLNNWPLSYFMGPYGVGGWFEVSAVSKSTMSVHGSKLVEISSDKLEAEMSVGISMLTTGVIGRVGAAAKTETTTIKADSSASQTQDIMVTTTMESHTRGPPATNPQDMQNLLHVQPLSWVIFPEISAQAQFDYIKITDMINDLKTQTKTAPFKQAWQNAVEALLGMQKEKDDAYMYCLRDNRCQAAETLVNYWAKQAAAPPYLAEGCEGVTE